MFIALAAVLALAGPAARKPNILFVLTDDQDQVLGGIKPMTKLKDLVAARGTQFVNAFVSKRLIPAGDPGVEHRLTRTRPHKTQN